MTAAFTVAAQSRHAAGRRLTGERRRPACRARRPRRALPTAKNFRRNALRWSFRASRKPLWRYAHQTAPTGKPFGIHHVSRAQNRLPIPIASFIPQFAFNGRSHELAARRANSGQPKILARNSPVGFHKLMPKAAQKESPVHRVTHGLRPNTY